jgi:hypothetical protein
MLERYRSPPVAPLRMTPRRLSTNMRIWWTILKTRWKAVVLSRGAMLLLLLLLLLPRILELSLICQLTWSNMPTNFGSPKAVIARAAKDSNMAASVLRLMGASAHRALHHLLHRHPYRQLRKGDRRHHSSNIMHTILAALPASSSNCRCASSSGHQRAADLARGAVSHMRSHWFTSGYRELLL